MILTKFSNLQIVQTAGTNLTVADVLSQDFSQITNKLCQLQQKSFLLILTSFNSNTLIH